MKVDLELVFYIHVFLIKIKDNVKHYYSPYLSKNNKPRFTYFVQTIVIKQHSNTSYLKLHGP